MPTAKYTPEQRKEALDLYVEVGPGEAARRTGINDRTIASWAHRAGLQSNAPASTKAAVDALKVKWEARRARLTDKLGGLAEHLADRAFNADPKDAKALVDAIDRAVSNAQLLSGGATSRDEVDVADRGARLAAVHQLKDQAAKRAAGRAEESA